MAEADTVPRAHRTWVQALVEGMWEALVEAGSLLQEVFRQGDVAVFLRAAPQGPSWQHITHSSPDPLVISSGLAALITFVDSIASPGR